MFQRILQVVIGLAIASIVFLLVGSIIITLDGLQDDLRAADLAVVPGAGILPNGQPAPDLRARLDQAVVLYRQGYFKLILVSGARRGSDYDEPGVMGRYLEAQGIPHDAIFEDGAGFHTWETAENTSIFLREHHLASALVVSQYFHMPRCRLAMERFGVKPVYLSHAHYWSLRDFWSVPREVVGWCVYAIRPLPPAS